MPFCTVTTNLPSSSVPDDFEIKLTELIAKVLNKAIEKISVDVHPGTRMCRGGSRDPLVQLSVWSIGVFSKEKNPEFGAPIFAFLSEQLCLPMQRIAILFHDLPPERLVPAPADHRSELTVEECSKNTCTD